MLLRTIFRKEAILSEAKTPPGNSSDKPKAGAESSTPEIKEKSLEKMEALLKQSAMGIHVLFDNQTIAKAMSKKHDDRDFLDVQKVRKIQDVMTELVAKSNYYDKVAYLEALDESSFDMLVRTYFHIVESTVRSTTEHCH